MRAVLITALAALALALPAHAHEAPPPRDFEVRAIHDHNDDAFVENAGKHAFDTIALDVREATHLGEPHLVLRFILNGGCDANLPGACPELRLVATFLVDGAEATVEVRAPDDRNVWEGDASLFVGPEHLDDGTRFAIEAWVPFAQVGATAGSTITDVFVRGYSGNEEADSMPEGAVAGLPDPLMAAFSIDAYTVRQPDYYLEASLVPDMVHTPGTTQVILRIMNLLTLAQSVTLTVTTPDGVDAALPTTLELSPNFAMEVPVELTIDAGANGPLAITAHTPLGGWANAALNVVVPLAEESHGNGTVHTTGHDHVTHSHDTPGVPLALLGVAVLALAVARRRVA